MLRTIPATIAVLVAVSAPAIAGQLQDLLDQGFRVVGVVPGQQQDPVVFIARDNQLYACRSFFVIRQMANQPQCMQVK